MGVLLTLRTELVEALSALDIFIYDHLPGAAAIPSAVVLAGSPYVSQGQTFGEHQVRFWVYISASAGDNQSETNELDELTEAAIEALAIDGWTVEDVSQPFQWDLNGASGYTTSIQVASSVTFN